MSYMCFRLNTADSPKRFLHYALRSNHLLFSLKMSDQIQYSMLQLSFCTLFSMLTVDKISIHINSQAHLHGLGICMSIKIYIFNGMSISFSLQIESVIDRFEKFPTSYLLTRKC